MPEPIIVPPVADLPDVTDQSVEQAAEKFFAEHGAQTAAQVDTQQPTEQIDTEPVAESPAEFDPNEQFFFAPGQALSRQQIANFATFNDLLESDPKLAQVILAHLRGEPAVSAQPQVSPDGRYGAVVGQPTGQPQPQPVYPSQYQYSQGIPPQVYQPQPQYPQQLQQPEVDLSDPSTAYLYNAYQQQQAVLANYHQELQRQQAILGSRIEADNRQIITQAVSQFQAQYELDDETMTRVREVAGRMEVIPTIMRRGIDPVTGQPTSPDPLNAVTRAMELASMAIPEIRDQILSNDTLRNQQDATRKTKLRAVGGSSRTAPRTAPVPSNPQDRQKAMVEIVRAAMNGTYQES